MAQQADVHIIFGTGPVGLAVKDELLARGKRVRMVNRSDRAAGTEGIEVRAGNASDPAFAKEACQGAAVVYQCLNPPYTQWPELFPPLQASVLAAATAVEAKLVSMENLYMYGATGGKPLVESLPYAAQTRKGRVRGQMAEELLAAHETGAVRVAIGRASDFFGPHVLTSAMGDRVFPAALAGKSAQILGNPDLPHTYTYVPDIGKALVVLGEEDAALGQAWHIPSPPTITTRQFVEAVYAEVGTSTAIQVPPKLLLRLLALFNPALREVLEMQYQFEEPFAMDHSKFVQAFGNHATPLPQAIRATVDWYRSRSPDPT